MGFYSSKRLMLDPFEFAASVMNVDSESLCTFCIMKALGNELGTLMMRIVDGSLLPHHEYA